MSLMRCVVVVPGPAGLFRRSALVEVGMYEAKKNCFAEDIEITIRLISKNYSVIADHSFVSRTQVPETMFDLVRQRYRWSRGTIQAVKYNWKQLVGADNDFGPLFALYIIVDALIVPFIRLGITVFFITTTVLHGYSSILLLGLMILMIVEVTCFMIVHQHQKSLIHIIIDMIVMKFTYNILLLAWNIICILEEINTQEMTWDKLDRRELIK